MRTPTITFGSLAAAAILSVTVSALPAQAGQRDSDGDRMPDRWESRFGLMVMKKDARADRDDDGLRNLEEFQARTSPTDVDSSEDACDGDLDDDVVDDEDEDDSDDSDDESDDDTDQDSSSRA